MIKRVFLDFLYFCHIYLHLHLPLFILGKNHFLRHHHQLLSDFAFQTLLLTHLLLGRLNIGLKLLHIVLLVVHFLLLYRKQLHLLFFRVFMAAFAQPDC